MVCYRAYHLQRWYAGNKTRGITLEKRRGEDLQLAFRVPWTVISGNATGVRGLDDREGWLKDKVYVTH